MFELKDIKKEKLFFYILIAFLTGYLTDELVGNRLDYWVHDPAVVFQSRTEWKHSGIVAMDQGVPFTVGRKQALPLFALATERLIQQGAKAVFLDARVSKTLEGRMPYAKCIENDGYVRWSIPGCAVVNSQQCQVNNSELGQAPLKMSAQAIQLFRLAPYLNSHEDLPDFLLFDWEAAESIPAGGLVVNDRLVTYDSPIGRWLDLSKDHAVYQLIELINLENAEKLFQPLETDQLCDSRFPCRRLRLSKPSYQLLMDGERIVFPVSVLAACDAHKALQLAQQFRDKVVILQTSAPNEATDLVVTPMTTALFGPRLMTPGAQFLVDEIETMLSQDGPVPPGQAIKVFYFMLIAIIGVLAGFFIRRFVLWIVTLGILFVVISLCFFNPVVQLWPVTAGMLSYFVGVGQIMTVLIIVGAKEGHLLKRYIPKQVRELLMPLKEKETFQNQRCYVTVLMSDLAGYTTVTGLLQKPDLVLELMNDYLNETSVVLQNKYGGILEAYVGDMVCYYWRTCDTNDRQSIHQKALLGAIELRELQKNFFVSLNQRYKNKIDQQALMKIIDIINAGIGITSGHVVMGDLGPEKGTKKFGILGDPLNLVARIEGLTRLFTTDIIVAGDFSEALVLTGLKARRIGFVQVKGRIKPANLYAIGTENESCFEAENILAWEKWIKAVEVSQSELPECPECYSLDKQTIIEWLNNGLLDKSGVWQLDKK